MKINVLAYVICQAVSVISSLTVLAQEPNTRQSYFITGIRAHYGFIIPHSWQIKEISYSKPWGIELDLNWHLKRRAVWDYCYCYPRTGISTLYFNWDNPRILGSSVAVYPFIEPFIHAQRKLSFSVRFGIGPAYNTTIYDEETNSHNLFFGSHISFIALLNFGVNYRPSSHVNTRLAFDYNHISNGGLKEPNLGINFPTLNLGVDYSFTPVSFEDREKDPSVELNPDKNRLDLILLSTAKNVEKGENHLFPVFGIGVNYSHVTGRIFALSAGAEWISDFSIREKIRRLDLRDEEGEYIDHNRIAGLAGVEWLFGRFIFSQHMGVYFYEPFRARNRAYQRYGLVFRINRHIFIGTSIKAHGHVADLLDARIGLVL
jgi:hypothetical protein